MISFISFNIPWMIDVFLFSYSFLHYDQAPKSSAAFELVNFIRRHVCITAVKASDVFYLRLLWRKSLFQIVTTCYRFLKNMLPLQK